MHETIITDAGRVSEGFGSERLDCTVRSFAIVAGITYARAHAILKLAGRKDNHCYLVDKGIREHKFEGYRFKRVGYAKRTIQRFIREHPVGRFYCSLNNHQIAIVDGKVHDMSALGSRRIIEDAWKVIPINMVVADSTKVRAQHDAAWNETASAYQRREYLG